ncbi:MAG: DNA-3-methyladenine glycosylase I [Verrucomicrobia bacterium]|nr:DNA-3-methyladenine glycosylase I [Verrucomicrobiota bacterium]
MAKDNKIRCSWPQGDERMQHYHDTEWGAPVHDDRLWFEHIVLDAFQAGLSWRTILHKREGFRKVFFNFEPARVARMTPKQQAAAMQNPAIVRNRLKIDAARKNARAFLTIQERHGSFDAFIWSFTDGKVVQNRRETLRDLPAATPLSDAVSKGLKAAGFSFVGTTICYAFLQAGGGVNDHIVTCFRHRDLRRRVRNSKSP